MNTLLVLAEVFEAKPSHHVATTEQVKQHRR
jgi:hypothetical protein